MSLNPDSQSWKKINNNDLLRLKHLQQGLQYINALKPITHDYFGSVVWQLGSMRLLEYGDYGTPMLLVPSLINHAYILDLTSQSSFMLQLKNLGLRGYLIDWGTPEEELNFNIEQYLNNRLLPAINFIYQRTSTKPIIAGYCMGGLMALAGANLWPTAIKGCATIATPWNFHAPEFLKYPITKNIAEFSISGLKNLSYIPKQWFNWLFYVLNSISLHNKYIEYGKSLDIFLKNQLMEQWANDTMKMSTHVFMDCMQDFIINNTTYHDQWVIAGQRIIPNTLKVPTFCAIALQDKIAPISSTLPLAVTLRDAHVKLANCGHLGMIISPRNNITVQLAQWGLALKS